MTDANKSVPAVLDKHYPSDPQTPAPDTKELDGLKAEMKQMKSEGEELKTQNKELTKKLEILQTEKKVALAEQVASVKIERGLLAEEGKKEAVEKLSKLSEETLSILHEELSQVNVKLSEPKPAPLSTPDPDPANLPEPSAEEKKATEVKEMRMKLFGRDDDPYDYHMAQKKVI